jgi:hypothetical protein
LHQEKNIWFFFIIIINFSEKETAVVEIGHMPKSCTDLKTIGYKMNGIFQIIGKKQIETVYCNFKSTNAEGNKRYLKKIS